MPALFSPRVHRIRQMRRQRASWKHESGPAAAPCACSSPPRRRCRGATRSRPLPVPTGEGEGRSFLRRWGGATEEKGGAELPVESETICYCAAERDVTKHENKEVTMECSAVGALISSYLRHVYAILCRVIAGSPIGGAPRSLSLARARARAYLGFLAYREGRTCLTSLLGTCMEPAIAVPPPPPRWAMVRGSRPSDPLLWGVRRTARWAPQPQARTTEQR